MLTGRGATYGTVEHGTTVAAGDEYGLTRMGSQGLEDLLTDTGEVLYLLTRGGVVNTQTSGGGGAGELRETKVRGKIDVVHKGINV